MTSVDSSLVERPVPPEESGSIPTSTLQFSKREWIVCDADVDIARVMIEREHYSRGAANTYTYLHGLFPRGWHWHAECAGVAWWIPPTMHAARALAGEEWRGVLSLSRLAIMPDVPKNAASFLISKSVRLIDRSKYHTLVSYADGWRGHSGAIYLAAGWTYDGTTNPETVYTLRGRMVARKAGQRTRTHAEMIALGAKLEGRFSKHRFVLRLK